jgi:ubiquinone/menaquinone biosynthesis C-methylase UbiE
MDKLRFYVEKFKNRKVNRKFKKNNPDVKLPPDYLIYESFKLVYQKYYTESIDSAKWIVNHIGKHIKLKNKNILDWGCGPGRIIRHLPAIVGNGCNFFGTDYNGKSIEWCSVNLPGIHFNKNSLEANLPYDDNFFDAIYGVSIFTHLSEKLHFEWYNELFRVLKPNGVMFLTTQGDNFKIKLTSQEIAKYENGELVVRGKVKEGHRTYSAFHPEKFIRKLFSNSIILEHVVTNPTGKTWLPQDIWIIKK